MSESTFNSKSKLIDELSKNLRKNNKEVEKSLNKLIELKLIEPPFEEEVNENDEDAKKQ